MAAGVPTSESGDIESQLVDVRLGISRLQRLLSSRRINASMAEAAGVDLSQQSIEVLRALGGNDPMPVGDLARSARMDTGAVSRQLRTLEELGLVERRASEQHGSTLAYGAGLSYGDSCLAVSGHVIHTRRLDRLISADWQNGVLRAECGVTLEAILGLAIPRGWFLPVTPGSKYVTLGGAMANDVHGKNHHRRGTFGCHVRCFGLLRSQVGRITCAANENSDLFAATIGGLGLTGIIEWAEIQLQPIRSSQVSVISQRFSNLNEFFALSEEFENRHEFCASWVDCRARGKAVGRGIFMAGDFAIDGPLVFGGKRKLGIPLTLPISLVNGPTLHALNRLYWRKAPASGRCARVSYDSFLYPLDAIQHWNRLYGPHGFQQYQALIPPAEARTGISALLAVVAESGKGSPLAVLKRFGNIKSPGLLSFPQPGTTLALDFSQDEQLASKLFPKLDAIVREAGGRLYPAKDAHMPSQDFQRGYPSWRLLETLRDPVLTSRFWKRVVQ